MRKFQNRRRLLVALACGALMTGLWVPAQAGNGQDKKCDPGGARGSENSRKSCPTTTTSSTTTTSTTTTTTTTMPPTLQDTVTGVIESAAPYERTYPDLVPDVTETYVRYIAIGYDEPTNTWTYGPPELAFDTLAKNFGTVAVDIQSDDFTNQTNPNALQCVAWTGPVCREREQVGGFEIHPGHGHIHFNDFAKYELRRLLPGGAPDYSASGLIAISDKVSFCLVDLMKTRDDAPPVGTYTTCSALREGISPGWADIYGSQLEGQQMSLAGLSDGQYALVITMNYSGNLYESDRSNNRVAVTVQLENLSGLSGTATIVGRSYS